MTAPSPDEVFAILTHGLAAGHGRPLIEVRRVGNEAVLIYRWPDRSDLFGVPVSLEDVDRRLDDDEPAVDLDDWLDSVNLWLMETAENWYVHGARRRIVDDYIELREPGWPDDLRFYGAGASLDEYAWLRLGFVERDGLTVEPVRRHRDDGSLVAWSAIYENNSTGTPYLGHAMIVRDGSVARLAMIDVVDGLPITAVLSMIRDATHAAADAGFDTVITDLAVEHLDVLGFRPDGAGAYAVDTRFLDEDFDAAAGLLAEALRHPGRWGQNRDRANRYLPRHPVARWIHHLRFGASGKPHHTAAG